MLPHVVVRHIEYKDTLFAKSKAIAADLPFDFIILDEHVDQMYRQDKRISKLIFIACGLSISHACLGLYGIISLLAEGRTKQISRITILLSGEFMPTCCCYYCFPLSYYFLDQWLNDFVYRINVPIDILILSVLLSPALAGLAVSFRSVKAAMASY